MAIKYAPYIDGILPAFTNTLRIPFRMSPAVAPAQVKGFCIKLLKLNGDSITSYTVKEDIPKMIQNGEVKLYYNNWTNMIPQNFYKIQLAYLDGTTEDITNLTFSTVGVIKRTNDLVYEWNEFKAYENNLRYNSFKLSITTEDCNEPIYSYQFKIYNTRTGSLFYQTDILLHNVETDTIIEGNPMKRVSELSCVVNKIYANKTQYKIYCNITTINNYTKTIDGNNFVPTYFNKEYITNLLFYAGRYEKYSQDQEEGRVRLEWNGAIPANNYMIRRSSSIDNFTTWDNIYSFAKVNNYGGSYDSTWDGEYHVLYDYTVEQGVTYKYYMVAYNANGEFVAQQQSRLNGGTNDKLGEPNEVYVDFEYIYLTDKDRQLKVKYKGAIANIKMTIQEQKVDTIGGQFPFFYRNGNLRYAEVPISGLISYHADENELFMTRAELGLESEDARINTDAGPASERHVPTTALTGYNFKAERDFKLAVRDWLMNGKPKLVRSPGEGNYIVRLMNVSLSPEQGTNNMIHNFSATGYQVAKGTYEDMKECGIVKW